MNDFHRHPEGNKMHYDSRISPLATIGKNNIFMEGVIVREGVTIGDNNYFGPYCIIGDSAEKIGYFDKKGTVVIGNNNRFTKQVTIDAGTDYSTKIGDNIILLKNAHIGHDAQINDGVVLSCNVCIGGHTTVGSKTNFGLGAVAHQRLKIPEGCMIGMNSTITKKTALRAWRKYVGSPARDIGENAIKM
jgi:UDP-N-acetylglucosamine acyltransferase